MRKEPTHIARAIRRLGDFPRDSELFALSLVFGEYLVKAINGKG